MNSGGRICIYSTWKASFYFFGGSDNINPPFIEGFMGEAVHNTISSDSYSKPERDSHLT